MWMYFKITATKNFILELSFDTKKEIHIWVIDISLDTVNYMIFSP